jgi:hypothetical protein
MCLGGKKLKCSFKLISFFVLLDWKTHENNYYECSKYRGQPQSKLETTQSCAREALKKYLHYFERVMKIGFLIYA